MKYMEIKFKNNYLKILLLSLLVFFLCTNQAYAFKSFASGEFYHKTITYQGITNISGTLKIPNPDKAIKFSDAAILIVQKAVRNVDAEGLLHNSGASSLKDGDPHCANEELLSCSALIMMYRKEILEILTQQSLPQNTGALVWNALGKALHTVQDYYSNSNWVERGNTQTNNFLFGDSAKTGGLLPPTELPPKPFANVAPACQPALPGSQVVNLADYPTSGFALDGDICNVTSNHPGRCVQGCTGPLCEQTPNSTCSGMNKSTSEELGGHAQKLHLIAANLAIQATTEFVNQIISELQSNQNINQELKDKALCAFLDNSACTSVLPIIPGMVGTGVGTPAGSGPNRVGGSIIHVTTLDDTGPGSLRSALLASGPRIVVFDVSGYIELQSRMEIIEPYLTIAGQTAPFPGISLKGTGLVVKTHDVLIQHIRIRVGDDPNGPDPDIRDGLEILGSPTGADMGYNIVIDHISTSWAIDENISTWFQGVHDVTVANSINSEALSNSIHPKGEHSKGFLVGYGTQNLLVIGNLFAHNVDRNMTVHGDTSTLFVNNLVYNWAGGPSKYGTVGTSTLDASIVGNAYIRGLDTIDWAYAPIQLTGDIVAGSRVFVEDTEAIESSSDPWSVVKLYNIAPPESQIRVNVSPNWTPNLMARKSNVVINWVLGNAGARRADGDPVDLRIINDVKNGTGRIIDSQNEVGGWPPMANNIRGVGGVPQLDIPSNEILPSGYTKIEEWLHLLAKQVEVPK